MRLKIFRNIKGDLFGGVTAGIVALPLALAFGVQSGLGAAAGLYGAIALGMIAAVFGGTKTQISGPTGPMTVVVAAVIAGLIGEKGSLESSLGLLILCFLLCGFFQIIIGVIKIGQYIKYIPYPVISGFMSGIGIIIILLQVFPMMGLASPKKIINVFTELPEALNNVNTNALLLCGFTIAVIYLFPKITKKIPATLIALIAGSLIPIWIPMEVPKIGAIPSGLPDIKWDVLAQLSLSDIQIIVIPAITLAALGTIDSLLTSVVADNITKTRHHSNKELVGQGMGNMAAALFGGIPGAGATMRTVVNINSGGSTRLSGVIHGLVLLIVLIGAGSYAREIPLSVLAGILITVGISIVDYKGFRHLTRVPIADAAVMLLVLLATVFVDLLQAVALGLICAALIFMKKMGDVAALKSKIVPMDTYKGKIDWTDEKDLPDNFMKSVFIKHLYGPLFFGSAETLNELATKVSKDMKTVVIRMEKVPYIDQSGLYALEDVILDLRKKDIDVFMTGLEKQPELMLRNIDIIPDLIHKSRIFESFTSFTENFLLEGVSKRAE